MIEVIIKVIAMLAKRIAIAVMVMISVTILVYT